MRTARNLAVAAVSLLLPALAAGADLKLASTWAATPPKVDGTTEGWSATPRPLGDIPAVVSVQNDADFLYLCLRTSNSKLKKQIILTGLSVWANGTGKTSTSNGFGIRYPLGGEEESKQREGRKPTPTPTEWSGGPGFDPPPPELELIGPSTENRRRVGLGGDDPTTAALGDDSGVMVLQVKLPLKASDAHRLAVGAAPGTAIAVQLMTEPPKVTDTQRWKDQVGLYGDQTARPGETNRVLAMPNPFSVWLQVTLATPPPSAAK